MFMQIIYDQLKFIVKLKLNKAIITFFNESILDSTTFMYGFYLSPFSGSNYVKNIQFI